MARRRVPNFCFEYVEGGSEDEATLRRNREVFSNIAFQPRTLVDVTVRNQRRRLLGEEIASPFLIGPTGFSGLLSSEGDVSMARAAASAGIPFVLSNVSTTSLEDVVRRAGANARVWMQVYMYRTREFVEIGVDAKQFHDGEASAVALEVATRAALGLMQQRASGRVGQGQQA